MNFLIGHLSWKWIFYQYADSDCDSNLVWTSPKLRIKIWKNRITAWSSNCSLVNQFNNPNSQLKNVLGADINFNSEMFRSIKRDILLPIVSNFTRNILSVAIFVRLAQTQNCNGNSNLILTNFLHHRKKGSNPMSTYCICKVYYVLWAWACLVLHQHPIFVKSKQF